MNCVIRKIRFCQESLWVFNSQIDEYRLIETGGVLLGYVESDTIFVAKASDGGPNAMHEEFNFRADPNYIDMFIDMEYANSGEKLKYLGEWHTHPQVHPEPTSKDLNSLEEIALSANDCTILLIIGAVGFELKNFLAQSIAIIKYSTDENFFQLQAEIE